MCHPRASSYTPQDNFLEAIMPNNTQPEELSFHVLTGEQFEDARFGKFSEQGLCLLEPAWLLKPEVRYYHERSSLAPGPDRRRFFLATRKSPRARDKGKREAVAVLEIGPEDRQDVPTMAIRYVSVLEPFRKQGLAIKLYQMLIEHLQASGEQLHRTRPGAQTPEAFTQAVTRLLKSSGVAWYSLV